MKKLFIVPAVLLLISSCTQKGTPGTKMSESQRIAEGKTIFENSCGTCHDLPDPRAHNDTEWIGIVNAMAPKAKVSTDQGALVYEYITSRN